MSSKHNTVLSKHNTMSSKHNKVLSKHNTMSSKYNTVLSKHNTIYRNTTQCLQNTTQISQNTTQYLRNTTQNFPDYVMQDVTIQGINPSLLSIKDIQSNLTKKQFKSNEWAFKFWANAGTKTPLPGHPFNHTVKITKSSLKTKNAHELTPELSSLSSSATIIAKSRAIRGRCGKKR